MSETHGYEHILYGVADHVATIALNRPERLNALSPLMRTELLDAVGRSDRSGDVRVMIVTGVGRGFCSGGDVKAMQEALESGDSNPLDERLSPLRDQVILAMRGASKPIIAAVNGAAAGAGMNIALACDIRIASTAARFGQTFSRRGLHPDWGGTFFLPRIVGSAKACELIWSGRLIDAQEALDLGIVSELAEPEVLLARANELAQTFVQGPPVAIRLSKRAIYRTMEADLREALEFETYAQNTCSETEDSKEGILAFSEKREPVFTGK